MSEHCPVFAALAVREPGKAMDADDLYSVEDIRAAGKRGEICSIDTEWIIMLLKESRGEKQKHKPKEE